MELAADNKRRRRFAPYPPVPIPDWRGFPRHHPRSSQIGEYFSDQAPIGVGLAIQMPIYQIAHLPILWPSSDVSQPQPHPPLALLLQIHAKVPFDKAVTGLSKAIFGLTLPLI